MVSENWVRFPPRVQWLFPFKEWWVVPVKVAFDQTVWSGVWNSIYFVALGLLRFENPVTIFKELKPIFFPLLTVRIEGVSSKILWGGSPRVGDKYVILIGSIIE